MASNKVVLNYDDLCAKGLISDLKLAAMCDVRRVCRLSCDHCPNAPYSIDCSKVLIAGLRCDHLAIKETDRQGIFEVHICAGNINVWLEKNELIHKIVEKSRSNTNSNN